MNITRTINSTTAKVTVFNLATNALEHDEIVFTGTVNDAVIARAKRDYEKDGKVFVKIDSTNTVQMVWELPEHVFIANAKLVEHRNSAIRMVTRNIKVYEYTVTYFNLAANALETCIMSYGNSITDKDKKNISKDFEKQARVFVKAEPHGTHENVLGMLETDFLKLAKPCERRNK